MQNLCEIEPPFETASFYVAATKINFVGINEEVQVSEYLRKYIT